MTSADCIFCKIAGGSIPCCKVFETDAALAFLDINPLAPGHCLLIPKLHYSDILDVPAEVLGPLTGHLPGLARAILTATAASGMNILQNTGESSGQAVFHIHFHLIPRIDGDKLGYRWNADAYPEGEADRLSSKIEALIAD